MGTIPQPARPNPVDQTTPAYKPKFFRTGYDAAQYSAQIVGPAAIAATGEYGSEKGAAAVAGAINAAAGFPGPGVHSDFNYNYGAPLALSAPGGMQAGIKANTLPPGGGGTNPQFNEASAIVSQMQQDSVAMFMLQTTANKHMTDFTMISNLEASRRNMHAEAIRNLRG